jgi:hypothetical protein
VYENLAIPSASVVADASALPELRPPALNAAVTAIPARALSYESTTVTERLTVPPVASVGAEGETVIPAAAESFRTEEIVKLFAVVSVPTAGRVEEVPPTTSLYERTAVALGDAAEYESVPSAYGAVAVVTAVATVVTVVIPMMFALP